MSNLLPYNEFVPYAPETGSVRVNHETDTCHGDSKSLKIERKDDGSISAYCFRCDSRGYRSDSTSKPQASSYSQPSNNAWRSNRRILETCDWPQHATKWIRQYGITNDEILENGIFYDRSSDRLGFSIYYRDKLYADKVLLRDTQNRDVPKWLSYNAGMPWYRTNKESDVLVLVEDVVSAIKVLRHFSAIAILSTKMNSTHLKNIIGYEHYVVWLDNDNRQVKLNQLSLMRQLQLVGKVHVIHHTDPKHCDSTNILKYIQDRVDD